MKQFCVNESIDYKDKPPKYDKNSDKRRLTHALFRAYRRYETLCGIFTLFTIVFLIIDYENSYNHNSKKDACSTEKSESENLRIVCFFLSLVSLYFLICRYFTESKWLEQILYINTGKVLKYNYKHFLSNRRYQLSIEIASMLIVPIPYYDVVFRIPQRYNHENIELCYRLDMILFCIGCLRLYFVLRALFNYSIFHNEQAQIFCINNRVDTGFIFTLKCLTNIHPYRMISLLACVTIIIGSFYSRLFERPVDSHISIFYDFIPNYFWFVFETISTTGYGDFTCITYGCRLVAVLTWFFGSIFVGLLIASMQQTTDMRTKQEKAFSLIRMSHNAIKLLKTWAKFLKARKGSRRDLRAWKNALNRAAQEFKIGREKAKEQCYKYQDLKSELMLMRLDLRVSSQVLDKLIEEYN